MSLADKLMELAGQYKQQREQRANTQRGIGNYLLSQGGPFTGLAGMLVNYRADKIDHQNARLAKEEAALAAQQAQQRQWDHEEAVAQRNRDWAMQDAQTERENKLADALAQYQREDAVAKRNREWDLNDKMALLEKQQQGDLSKALLNYQNKNTQGDAFGQEYQKQRGQQYAQMQKDLAEGRGNLDALKKTVERALELNKEARSGFWGEKRQTLGRIFGGGEQTTAGAELQGLMKNELVGQLKKAFGGNITEGEREYLNQLYAADLSMAEGEREALIRNLYDSALKKQQAGETAFANLFGGRPQPPQQGQEMDGYVFLGGDPADPKNWRAK